MKNKSLLLLLLLSLVFYSAKAQIQTEFIDYKASFQVGINSSGPIRILDFQGKKLLVFNLELALLDTTTVKFTPLSFPLNGSYPYIRDAAVDNSGKLTLLFYNAFFQFDGQKWETQFLNPYTGWFSAFMIDSSNLVHCLMDSSGIYCDRQWNGANWHTTTIPLWHNEYVSQYLAGPKNDCRLLTSTNRILYYSAGSFSFKDSIKNSPSYTYSVTYDKAGDLWYGSHDTLIKLDTLGHKTLFNPSNSPFHKSTYLSILINQSGNRLLYKISDTLYQYKSGAWSLLTLLNNNNSSPFFQANNEVWVYDNSQIKVFGDKLLNTYNNLVYTLNNLHPKCMLDFTNGNPGDVWIGTENGIYDFYNGYYSALTSYNLKVFDTSNTPLTDNHVNALAQNNTGYFYPYVDTLFIGTNKGLFVMTYTDSLSLVAHYTTSNSTLPSDTISSLKYFNGIYTQPYRSQLWIGTNNGAALLNFATRTLTEYDTSNSALPSNHVNNITSQNSFVFICTDSGFVEIADTAAWKVFTTSNSGLTCPDVRSVTEEDLYPKGKKLWIGTMGGGLASYTDTSGSWSVYSKTLGNFPSDSINFLYNYSYYAQQYPNSIIGTKDTGIIIFNSPGTFSSTDFMAQDNFLGNIEKNIFSYDEHGNYYCDGGWDFVGLTDSGFVRDFVCYGGVKETKPVAKTINAWIDGTQLNISWSPLVSGKANVCLYDMMGRNVMNVTGIVDRSKHITTPMPQLASGIYLVRITQQGKAGSQLLPVIK